MVEELLQDLVRLPSVTPHDAGCQDLVSNRLGERGFSNRRLDFGETANLWATHGDGAPLIVLAGHTDVVPPGPRDAWTSDPFEPTIRDGRIYGRGASDMKASDAAMVVALERLAQTGHPGTIALLLTSDEEGSGHDGTPRALDALIADGVKISAALVGEPTSERCFGDAFKVGRRGSMTGTITVSGVQGHTAYPHLALNAVHRLAPAMAKLVEIDLTPTDPNFPPTTFQIVHLKAGAGASNVIPGTCEVKFNIRFGVGLTHEQIAERVSDVFTHNGILDPISWDVSAHPFLTTDPSLTKALSRAVERVAGIVPSPSTGGGTSDARHFAARGIPVVEFGPLNASIHKVDEWVDLECLEPLARIYEETVLELLSQSF